MSRIPVRTPSRNQDASGKMHVLSLPSHDTGYEQSFSSPIKPKRAVLAQRDTSLNVDILPTMERSHTASKSKVSSFPPSTLRTLDKQSTVQSRNKACASRDLRQVKSSVGLREHIARARADLQRSAKKSPTRSKADHALTLVELQDSLGDPFSAMKDPFNQARHAPKTDPLVAEAVRKARIDGRLNISSMRLATVPQAVCNMYKPDPALVIDFSSDQTTSWYEYVDLTHVNAAENELVAIDDQFVDIIGGISSFDLHDNRLTSFPCRPLDLSQLTSLNLAGNSLKMDFISEVSTLTALIDLKLSRNDLSGPMPSCLGRLVNLLTLDISDNSITSVPNTLTQCLNLQSLDVSGNKLNQFSLLSSLPNLIHLNASRNAIADPILSRTLELPQLNSLDLSHNALSEFSVYPAVVDLPMLESLNLCQNSLRDISAIRALNLVSLNLEGNHFHKVPFEVLGMTKLKHLDISDNRMDEIDCGIGMMNITQLRWEGNPVRMKGCFGMSTDEFLKYLRGRSARSRERTDVEPVQTKRELDLR